MILQSVVVLSTILLVSCGAQQTTHVETSDLKIHPDFEPDASPAWKVHSGLEKVPELPAAMAAWKDRVFLVHSGWMSEFNPAEDRWVEKELRLPGMVGSGVSLAVDHGRGQLYVLRGGNQDAFWRIDLTTRKIEVLPPIPDTVGRGGALCFDHDRDQVYAVPGKIQLDFYRYDLKAKTWTELTRVGGKTRLAKMGQSTSALQYSQGKVYAWPDHHIQRFDVETGVWYDKVHMSYGQRPWWDGSAWAHDVEKDVWYVIQGMSSRTFSYFDPNKRHFAFLMPRLPLRMSGQGSRAVVVEVGGKKRLFIYAIQQNNVLISIG
ncbi:MAG: hypothetical protein KDB18_08780, partial [Salinibacterium sp.]|nr:hypothetical protein [Salinibacterium sp.]